MWKIVKISLIIGMIVSNASVVTASSDPAVVPRSSVPVDVLRKNMGSYLSLKDQGAFAQVSKDMSQIRLRVMKQEIFLSDPRALFVPLDQKFENYLKNYEVKDRKTALSDLSKVMQSVLKSVKPETILVFKMGSSLLSLRATTGPGAGTAAAAGAGGPSAASGGSGGGDGDSFSSMLKNAKFSELSSYDLFGDSPFAAVTANSYRFFKKTETPALRKTEADKLRRFAEFQKSVQYVLMHDIIAGIAELNETAIPHVILEDSDIDPVGRGVENMAVMGTFFHAHPEAVAVLNVEGPRVSAGTLILKREHLPENVHNLIVTNTLGNVRIIGNMFLEKCTGLTSINLIGLTRVTTVGSLFLDGCTGLTSINLIGLTNVTTVGTNFLFNCLNLESLDLEPLSNLRFIGSWFLHGCIGLKSLDLGPLSNVVTIGDFFLDGCTGLKSLGLRPLSNVTTIIGSNFLSRSGLHALRAVITTHGGPLNYIRYLQGLGSARPAGGSGVGTGK